MADSIPADQTHPSLLVRIRDARDLVAWSTFLETYTPLVYRFCRRRGLQDADAVDVAQDVMTQVSRSVRDFEYQPGRGRFRDWLRVVVQSRLANHYRAARRAVQPFSGAELVDCESSLAHDGGSDWEEEFHAQVMRVALDRIRPHFEAKTWRAFELVWLEGQSASDAARELSLPIDAVYVAKSRVLKRLRAEVEVLADDLPISTPAS